MNDMNAANFPRGPMDSDAITPAGGGDRTEWKAIDLRAIWSAVYRSRYLVGAIILACLAIGLVITFLSTPIYRATARIQIDLQAAKILEGDDVEPKMMQDSERFLQTQLDVVKSRGLAEQVAENLRLFRNTDFLTKMNIRPAEQPKGVYNLAQTRREQVLDALQDHLIIKLPVESSVVSVTFESPDRRLSAQVANGFADTYIVSNLQRKYDTSAYARRFLDGQLRQTRQRLEESERAMIGYARNARLIDTNAGQQGGAQANSGPRSLTTSNLVQINESYSQAIAARIAAEQKWREASGTSVMSLPEVLASPAIQSLVQERARLQSLYDQNAGRYKPEFPVQAQAAQQIKALTAQINRLAANIRDGIRQQYEVARRQEAGLSQSLSGFKDNTLAEQDRSVRYNILRREVDTNRTLYDALLQRFKEISATAGIASNNVSIVDRADPPINPVSPRPLLNMALALVSGLLLGIGYVILRQQLDDAIRSVEDIERKLGVPMIGLVPNLSTGQTPVEELRAKRSEMSEAYSALRGSLMLATPSGPPRSILVTSSGPSEGKSTSSYAVARGFAQIGRRVVLIDADMRKPAQHHNVGVKNEVGLANVLANQRTVDQVLLSTDQDNMDFIPAGPIPVNPAELIAGPGMQSMLEVLKQRYDIIIVDAPPVLGLADAPALASQIEGTVFVVQANGVHGRRASGALNRLRSAKAQVIGVLLTKFDAKAIGYLDDYGYSYNYGVDKV